MVIIGQFQTGSQLGSTINLAIDLLSVHIKSSIGYTGVVPVGFYTVTIGCLNINRTAVKFHTRLQFFFLVHGHRVNHRVHLILCGAAINKGQVIKIKRSAVTLCFLQLSIIIKGCQIVRNRILIKVGLYIADNIRGIFKLPTFFSGKLGKPFIIPIYQNDVSVVIGLALDPTDW